MFTARRGDKQSKSRVHNRFQQGFIFSQHLFNLYMHGLSNTTANADDIALVVQSKYVPYLKEKIRNLY